jgi:ribosome-binding protein aMBF1 (putative translation factor)
VAENPPCKICHERPATKENGARMLVCDECFEVYGDNEGDWR